MSGLVAALSGLFFRVYLSRKANEEVKHLADHMELET
jgi:biopolymer transport protein ExbB/TolQ